MKAVHRALTLLLLTTAACAPGSPLEPSDEGVDDDADSISNAEETAAGPQFMRVKRGSSSCSATMLTRSWLLTAAHCAGADPRASIEIRWVDPDGDDVEVIYQGSAWYHVHPAYEPGSSTEDVALIELDEPASAEWRGRLYVDDREPWRETYQGDRSFIAIGWGRGSDSGSDKGCPTGGGGVKRRSDGWELQPTAAQAPRRATATHPTQELCPGDSGASWSFRRDKRYLTFAVHHGGTGVEKATLIRPKIEWMGEVLAGSAECSRHKTSDGFAYLRCQDL